MATALKDRRLHEGESDKDSTEEELERLVFGDSTGFRENVRSFRDTADLARGKELAVRHDEDEDDEEATGLEGLADQDLFFLDDTPGNVPLVPIATSDDESIEGADGAAWSDSDDERVTVSIASRTQLRKLRKTEADDIITGKEYSRRLRKQFQLLNPAPEWVHTATGAGRARKKRRTSTGSETTESSEDEMDIDGDEGGLSAQPLARLLQDADALTRTSNKSSAPKKRKLRPEVIDIQRMKDIVSSGPSAVTCLQVHPSLPLLISSGPSKTISLHHLRPQPPDPNPLLTTLHLKRTPLHTTLFHPSKKDARIFLSGRRRYFHVWNLGTGHVEKVSRIYGHADEQRSMEHFKISPDGAHIALLGSARRGGGVVNVLDANTLQWVAQARVESLGGVADFAWWRDSNGLCIVGKGGEVTEWLLSERVAVARWKDEGAVGTTTLALGGDSGRQHLGGDRWIAVGSSAGIVNIYDRRAWVTASPATEQNNGVPTNPKPVRVLDQLVTPISHLHFSPDGQVMCMASRWKTDALRLVHLPTCTVYRNWPTGKTPLGRVSAVAFGEDAEGGLCLVAGNEKGTIRGWEIRG